MTYAVVVPTVGRPSLTALLDRLAAAAGPAPEFVVVVDDRAGDATDPVVDPRTLVPQLAARVVVARSGGRGPAAARNVGWRLVPAPVEWIAFLDDDVLPDHDWPVRLADDLERARTDPAVAGSQGRIVVPLPADRRPTDWERGTAGLAAAWWITADMAYRRDVLEKVGGFDERFPRAFREDSDLAIRAQDAGFRLVTGDRCTVHPVRPAPWWVSAKVQRGNADDVLMRRLHGRGWRDRSHDPDGRTVGHAVTVAAGAAALAAALARRPGPAAAAAAVWAVATARFAAARIAPGPRTPAEVAAMLATSVAVPPLAVAWRWRALLRPVAPVPEPQTSPLRAVLFDRDGTLVEDVPYNGDPDAVTPVTGAVDAVAAVRAEGLAVGVVTNQSGVARGLLTAADVERVNARVAEVVGGVDVWSVCPHGPDAGCGCRKPAPGGVLAAAAQLGVPAGSVALVGDIGSDVDAALAAGARAVLVPTEATRPGELATAPVVCADIRTAVAVLLGRADVRAVAP